MRLLGTVVAAAAVLYTGAWVLLHPRTRDPFSILVNHAPVDVGVVGPGSFGPKEVRTYSWRQPWRSVVKEARRDLPARGLKERRPWQGAGPGSYWLGGHIESNQLEGTDAELEVDIEPGRTTAPVTMRSGPDGDSDWVTVTVIADLDDNWINMVRYTCFPMQR